MEEWKVRHKPPMNAKDKPDFELTKIRKSVSLDAGLMHVVSQP